MLTDASIDRTICVADADRLSSWSFCMADSGRFRRAHGAWPLTTVALALAIIGLAPGRGAASFVPAEIYAITAWTTESGLPAAAGSVLAIAQDRVGYLWLGTRSRPVRFDGSQFFPWGSRGETSRLPGTLRAGAARAHATGRLVGQFLPDASRITRIHERQRGRVPRSAKGCARGNVHAAILEDRRGATVGPPDARGLARFDGQRWPGGREPESESAEVFSIHEDRTRHTCGSAPRRDVFTHIGGRRFEFAVVDSMPFTARAWQRSASGDDVGHRSSVSGASSCWIGQVPLTYAPDFQRPLLGGG